MLARKPESPITPAKHGVWSPPTSTTMDGWTYSLQTIQWRTSSLSTGRENISTKSASPPESGMAREAKFGPAWESILRDINQDGWMDLFVTNIDHEMYALYQNKQRRSI